MYVALKETGEQTLSLLLQELVPKQVEIMPMQMQLLQPDSPLGGMQMDFWLDPMAHGGHHAQN